MLYLLVILFLVLPDSLSDYRKYIYVPLFILYIIFIVIKFQELSA